MSTATVSSPKKTVSKQATAKWDDERTKLLLELFEAEINAGNRHGGVYSKQSWLSIVTNFNERTGLDYNKEKLKNQQDNLRREYTKWEVLIGKEFGLGWDNDKRTLAAPDSWWIERAKSDPAILRYKDGGPAHLELLQKVFGGTTATGFNLYIPSSQEPVINQTVVSDSEEAAIFMDNLQSDVPNEGVDEAQIASPTPASGQSVSKLRSRKRPRDDSGRRVNQSEQFTTTVDSLNDTLRENVRVMQRLRPEEDNLSYTASLDLLNGIPGFSFADDVYWKGVRVLEDKTRRIAFRHALAGGREAVLRWLKTFPDV